MGIRIIEHTTDLTVRSDDFLIKDSSTNGTKKITPEAFAEYTNGQMKETVSSLTEATSLDDNDLLYVVTPASPNVAKKVKKSTLKSEMKPSDYTGATSSTNGANGLVPQPTTSDVDRFLKGDGTWGDISYAVGEASGSIATFSDGSPLPMRSLKAYIEPVQDLHGYDRPWVGGAGKNKAQPVITTNTTLGGIAFNPIKDNDGNVLGLSVGNGTVNTDINQHIAEFYCSESGTYKIIGAKLNDSLSINKRILLWDNTSQTTTITIIDNNEVSVSLTAEHEYSLAVNIRSSVTVDASELRFMICKDSESSTFAPYSNICPISGWTSANVNRAKVYQICEPSDSTEVTVNGVTMTYLGKGKYRVKGTPTANEYTALNIPIVPFTIYDGDDAYIKINNSVGLSNATLIFNNGTSQIDSWGLYPSNRRGTYVGMRNKYTNNITIAISSSGYGTNFDFTFKVEILSNSTTNLSTYTIQFTDGSNPLTVYGGYVDIVSGVLIVDGILETIDPSKFGGTSGGGLGWIDFNDSYVESLQNNNVMCNKLGDMVGSDRGWTSTTPCIAFRADPHIFRLYGNSALFSSGGAYENTTIYYKLKIPFSIQLTPTQVKSLLGENNVWADTGDVDVHYVRDLTITIDDILSRLEAIEG